MPPLYTKERNVGCGLERNVRTSRHLVSSFFFFFFKAACKAGIAARREGTGFDPLV